MAICEDDIDPGFIASARAVLVTGRISAPNRLPPPVSRRMQLARDAGRKVAFDIDYRPNLWALGAMLMAKAGLLKAMLSPRICNVCCRIVI